MRRNAFARLEGTTPLKKRIASEQAVILKRVWLGKSRFSDGGTRHSRNLEEVDFGVDETKEQ